MKITRKKFIRSFIGAGIGMGIPHLLSTSLRATPLPEQPAQHQPTKYMYACQWTLRIVFGKQKEALEIMKQWGAEKFRSSHFKVSTNRVMTGFVGESPSYIVDEYLFESLADYEKALADMSQPQFKQYAEAIAPYIVPGSQQWTIYRIVS
jgi:hypothetical protein